MSFLHSVKEFIWPDNFWHDLTKGKYFKRGVYQGQVKAIGYYQRKAAKKARR